MIKLVRSKLRTAADCVRVFRIYFNYTREVAEQTIAEFLVAKTSKIILSKFIFVHISVAYPFLYDFVYLFIY